MSKTTLAAISLGVMLSLRAAEISEVPLSRVKRQVPAFSPGGRIQVQGGEALVNVWLADGTPTKGDLVVLIDPSTNRFFWQNFTMSPRRPFDLATLGALVYDKHQAIISMDQSIAWWRSESGAIETRTSTETAESLDDAFVKAVSELRSGWDTRYSKADYPNRKIVAFRNAGDLQDFATDPAMPSAMSWPSIENVVRIGNGFKVTLRGMWFGELTIGDDLVVKEKFHRVPEPKQE